MLFNNSTMGQFEYEVEVLNSPPVIVTNASDQIFSPGSGSGLYNVSGYFSDPEGGAITYITPTLTNGSALPAWITFDGQAFTIDTSSANTAEIQIIASDPQSQTASQSFNISVVNSPPSVISPLGTVTGYENITFSYSIDLNTVFNEPDGQPLTYNILSLPGWTKNVSLSGSILSMTENPVYADIGSYTFSIEASDGSLSVVDSLTINIVENYPPVAPTISDITVNEGDSITHTIPVFTDPESNSITYDVLFGNGTSLDPTWITFDEVTRVITANTYVGIDTITPLKVVATDSYNPEVVVTIQLIVNKAPQLNSTFGTLQFYMTAQKSSSFTIDSDLFYDEDTTLSYTLTETNGTAVPAWLTFTGPPTTSTGTFTFSGTYPTDQEDSLVYVIHATDSQGQNNSVSVFINIQCK